MNNLGYKIKILRKNLSLKQEDLTCEYLNRTSLSKIENNLLMPSILQLKHLSKKLGVSIDFLLDENKFVDYNLELSTNTRDIEELFLKDMFLDIIDKFKPYDFVTYYYIGMSYYKLDLKKNAEPLLDKCESLFNSLTESEKLLNVENLCVAINSLRKVKVKDLKHINNYKYLNAALNYLNLYHQKRCEIYFILNNNIGVYFILNKQYDNAISHYESFFSNNFSFMASKIMASLHLNLSIAYFAVKSYDKSIDYLKKAIFFYNFLNDEVQSEECYLNLFNCYLYKNCISECTKIINYVFENFHQSQLLHRFKVLELALLYNLNGIETILEKKKTINYKLLRLSTKMDYHFIMGRTYFLNSSYKTSISHYNKCLNYLINKEKYFDLYIAYSDLYIITGDYQYDLLSTKYHDLYLSSEYNNISCNISSPFYNYKLALPAKQL